MTTPPRSTTSPPPPAAPPSTPSVGARFLAPDLARGLMLALIAMANVMIYLHVRPEGPPELTLTLPAADRIVAGLMTVLVDARAYPLFAALFGYGLVEMTRRRRERGLPEAEVRRAVRRRSVVLIAFGAVHALLAFSGDILGFYGLLGLVTVRLLRRDDRALLRFAGLWLVPASALQGFLVAAPPGAPGGTIFTSYAIEDPLAAAPWRMVEWLMAPFGLLAALSALLVGAWAARHRILEHPEQHRGLLRRTAVIGVGAGILGGLGMGLVDAAVITPSATMLVALSGLHVVTGVLAGFGVASLIALLAAHLRRRDTADGPVVRALTATGERSLSAYLAQSLVFAGLLSAGTLGWGAHLGPSAAALLGLLTWALTVVGAAALARAGRRGPAEALLRRLLAPSSRSRSRATIGA